MSTLGPLKDLPRVNPGSSAQPQPQVLPPSKLSPPAPAVGSIKRK